MIEHLASQLQGGRLQKESWTGEEPHRIDGWWDRPTPGFEKASLGQDEPKESAKDEAQLKALGLRPVASLGAPGAASRVFDERPDKERRAALDPAPGARRTRVA